MATVTVLEADGVTETDIVINDNGRALAVASKPVALATEDKTKLDEIAAALAGTIIVDGSGVTQTVTGTVAVAGSVAVTGTFYPPTQPISAAALPLPTGAATAAKQDSLIAAVSTVTEQQAQTTQLAAINTKLAASLAVTGPVTDAQLRAAPVPVTGTVSVTGTFWQATQPVSVTTLPLPSGAATSALQTTGNDRIGTLTETAPTTDTASSGVNGRLQRIAQRLSTLISALPASLGIKTAAASLSIAPASDATFTVATHAVTQSGAWSIDSITGSQVLPTGAATSAKQDTIIGHVDGLEQSVGAVGDAAWTSGSGSMVALLKAAVAELRGLTVWEYEFVEASTTDQMLGAAGAVGDVLHKLIITPLTKDPGAVSIEDGTTNTVVFAGGTASVATLHPFEIDFGGLVSVNGGWEITTGANVRVTAIGRFA